MVRLQLPPAPPSFALSQRRVGSERRMPSIALGKGGHIFQAQSYGWQANSLRDGVIRNSSLFESEVNGANPFPAANVSTQFLVPNMLRPRANPATTLHRLISSGVQGWIFSSAAEVAHPRLRLRRPALSWRSPHRMKYRQ